ncbi:MAG: mannosyltransferase family protein [Micromonosporaceae bacterium]
MATEGGLLRDRVPDRLAGPAAPPGLLAAAGGWAGIGSALAVFASTRALQLALVLWMLPGGRSLRDALLAWDAGWFVRVASEGYPTGYSYDETGALTGNGFAFFPLYPLLIRAATLPGLAPEHAAVAVAWLASAAAAVLVYLLGTSLYDRRVGHALLVLVCTQPMSVVLSLAYSEGLFLALVAGMLLAAHRGAWPAAGALGLSAALTRPTGVAAGIALAVAAVLALRGPDRPTGRRAWVPVLAALAALAGGPAYLLWVGLRVGEPDAWLRIQSAGWGTSFDFGASVGEFLRDTLRAGEGFVPVSVAWLLLAALVAAGVALAARVWAPLAVYGVLALVLVFGQAGYYHSKPRLLVCVLLTLVPGAVAAARARPATAAVALSAFAAFGLWYGAYLLTVWPYTI